ncbi:MAG TPA: hypothetical protein VMN99_02560 [Anaerolineales bacterium]|nr:hypothetical protein [Anaerolineales bacterium]
MESKRDLSISMARTNLIVLFISIPVVTAQIGLFVMLHGMENLEPTWSSVILLLLVFLGVVLHELIHGRPGMQVEDHPTSAGCYVIE